MTDTVGALSGLVLGLVGGGCGWYFGRRAAAKQNGLDERNELIEAKAKATAWWITFAAMVVAWVVVILDRSIPTVLILAGLYVVHLAGWAISLLYFHRRY